MEPEHDKAPKPQKPIVIKKEGWAPAIKWIAIFLTMLLFTAILYKAYRVATAPVRTVTNMKDQAAQIVNRLDVDVEKARSFGELAETAFETLNAYPVRKPGNITERLYWAQNLRNSNNQVCKFYYDFGNGPVPIYVAANNKTYATAKAVGSRENRVIRVQLLTGEKHIGLRAYWDQTVKGWKMRWRRITLAKDFNDETANNTLRAVLSYIPQKCVVENSK